MPREANKWLEDISTYGRDALEFLEGKSEKDYLDDKSLRASVERQLFVIGEAVTQLRKHFPDLAEKLHGSRDLALTWPAACSRSTPRQARCGSRRRKPAPSTP